MALTDRLYAEAVRARNQLQVADVPAAKGKELKSLSDCGWDGNYVVPNQLSSCSFDGPVILLNNWYGWEALETLTPEVQHDLQQLGYLRGIPTNRWLDRALQIIGLNRGDVYVTQASVLLPQKTLGSTIPKEVYSASVEAVLRKELAGRIPVALGKPAQLACANNDIPYVAAQHPSYQGGERRSQEIADAIRKVI